MNRVSKVVPPKRTILRDISLSFFPGAKIGVLGLNGSGKSSLLRIMAGIGHRASTARPARRAASASASCRRSPSSMTRRTCAPRSWKGVGEHLQAVGRVQPDQRQVRRADVGRRDDGAARETGQAAGRHRRRRRLGAGTQARDRRRRPAPAALGGEDRPPVGRREAPRRAVPAAAVGPRHAAAR